MTPLHLSHSSWLLMPAHLSSCHIWATSAGWNAEHRHRLSITSMQGQHTSLSAASPLQQSCPSTPWKCPWLCVQFKATAHQHLQKAKKKKRTKSHDCWYQISLFVAQEERVQAELQPGTCTLTGTRVWGTRLLITITFFMPKLSNQISWSNTCGRRE